MCDNLAYYVICESKNIKDVGGIVLHGNQTEQSLSLFLNINGRFSGRFFRIETVNKDVDSKCSIRYPDNNPLSWLCVDINQWRI